MVGIGPWKDTIVFPTNNYLNLATDLVARAHAHGLQVHILYILHKGSSMCYFLLHNVQIHIALIKQILTILEIKDRDWT